MARSEVSISAIFASRALASSSLVAAVFRSLTSSFIAARSSSVSTAPFLLVAVVLLADFFGAFVGLIENLLRFSLRLLRLWLIVSFLDLPAEALRVEALRFLHVIDAQKDRADVRIHFASPQYLLKP